MLEPLLLEGAMARGWADERWTLSRVRMLIADHLVLSLSIRGVWELLRRHGWSRQQPARRAVERDEAAVASWEEGDLAPGKPPRRRPGHDWSSKDEAAVSMTPHRARTWAPKGSTPVVRFNGASRGRISMAALVCFKAGERSRLIHRPRIQGHHRGAHRGFTWQDNLNVHRCSRLGTVRRIM